MILKDVERRDSLKKIIAFSTLAVFGNNLFSNDNVKDEILVLLNDSIYNKDFISGIKKVESKINYVENINLIENYNSFNSLFNKYLTNKNLKTITGLLSESDYALFVNILKEKGISLNVEISHLISNEGTKHHISTNNQNNLFSNIKTTLQSEVKWPYSIAYILNSVKTNSHFSIFSKNEFKELTIKRLDRGEDKLVSFLATIKKENLYV